MAMSENNPLKKCASYCLALRFDINELAKRLSDSTLIRIIKGALLIEDDQSPGQSSSRMAPLCTGMSARKSS